ncbi:MAG: hypothetical protein HYW24_04020 [Candidatus Aenigmarchaeota archaeon]|nr:hypothetical protein [Candidatus Aenigmarchaeota archaeon]
MPDKIYDELKHQLYHHHDEKLSFGEILPFTVVGAVGGILATTFELAGYPRTPLLEGGLRLVSGSGDSISEGIYTIRTELPKYLRKSLNNGGPAVYYVGGKLIGAALSWLPDYFLRSMGVDVHSSFPGSIVPAAYAQFDQVGAYLGMLAYHIKNEGLTKGFIESIKDPVSQTSLLISGGAIGIDTIARIPFSPSNFWHDWIETYALSFLCVLPVWRGRQSERNNHPNSK